MALYAMLTLDGRRLLMPQGEILSLEPLMDVTAVAEDTAAVGAIAFGGHWWPVYCLSGELELLRETPLARRVCVLLNDGEHQFAMACDAIEPLGELQPRPLPACMRIPDSPLQALLVHQGELGCVTSTARLAAYLAQWEAEHG